MTIPVSSGPRARPTAGERVPILVFSFYTGSMVALKNPDPRTVTPFFRNALAYMARTVDAVALENFVDYLAGNSQGSGGSP